MASQKMAIGFKGYLMQSENVRLQMMKAATGIPVLGINKTYLLKIKVHIPCLEEQKKIAEFLSAIDDKIDNLEKELKELKAYKKGIMQTILASADGAASKD